MNKNHLRSLLKTLSYRVLSAIVTAGIVYAFTREIMLSAAVGGVDVFIKSFFYYLHERFWEKSKLGHEGA